MLTQPKVYLHPAHPALSRPYTYHGLSLSLKTAAVIQLVGPVDTRRLQLTLDGYGFKVMGRNKKNRRFERYLSPADYLLTDAADRLITESAARVFHNLKRRYGRDIALFIFK